MKKTANLIQLLLFCVFIGGFFIYNLATPDRDFSEQENRYLSHSPKFTLESFFSGEYTSKFETFLSDQFAFRDSWITLKARAEILSGKSENNGVYLCDGEILIPRFDEPEDNRLLQNIAAVNALSDNAGDIPVYFELIPGAASIWADKLPDDAPMADQLSLIESTYSKVDAVTVDTCGALSDHSGEYIYYHTDHHWTSLGAYYGYTALMGSMGMTPSPLSSFTCETVADDFYGTSYSSSGITWVEPDRIETFVQVQDDDLTIVDYAEGGLVKGTLYDYAKLEAKDKYSFFLGGNTSLLKITTGVEGAPEILILRDSYADCRVPFLLEHFSEIHLIDLRYYKTSVSEYISEHDIDIVLVSYSVDNFATDNSIFLAGR